MLQKISYRELRRRYEKLKKNHTDLYKDTIYITARLYLYNNEDDAFQDVKEAFMNDVKTVADSLKQKIETGLKEKSKSEEPSNDSSNNEKVG